MLSKALEAKSLPITPTQDFRREFADYGDDISPFDPADIAVTPVAEAKTYSQLISQAQSGTPVTEAQLVAAVEAGNLNNQQASDVQSMIDNPQYTPSKTEQSIAGTDVFSSRAFPETPPNPNLLGPEIAQSVGDFFGGAFGGRTIGEQEAIDQKRLQDQAGFDAFQEAGGFREAVDQSPDPSGYREAIQEGVSTAGFTPDAAKAVAIATAEASKDPGADLPSTIGANLGAGSSSSIEEATKAQYKFLKDFLGIGERDKQKEFNLMAMQFFTALAAGQSPDALANLNAAASTAIAGLAAADKERTELDRSIKLAAFDRASELDSAAVARKQRIKELIKEYQLRTNLEIKKIETDAAYTPGKPFLSTATGKAMLAEYKLYIDPASGGLTPDQAFEKMTSSGGVARDQALITLFKKSLGYTSDNQGKKTDGATKFDQRQKKGSQD